MSNFESPGPIPNRWLHCPRKSERIIAEKFIAFKTPLSTEFTSQVPAKYLFLPDMMFGYMKSLKMKLGLWIDLTNTKRFYKRDVVEAKGAKYIKLQCRGHGETPSPEQVQAFIDIVDNFITEHPQDIIGVHCTHGFNRTGFLIVSYVVEKLDCSVQAALAAFAEARPPGIYKQDYIDELFRRYDEEDACQAPELPTWYFESEPEEPTPVVDSRKRDRDNDREKPSHSKKKRRAEVFIEDAKFMEGVDRIEQLKDISRVTELQRKVQGMCDWQGSGFPGAQPVSMHIRNIQLLSIKEYMVSWKADGSRYMMLINKRDEIYFFDRNFTCFVVPNMVFPQKTDLNEHIYDTLVDGEMVIDTVGNAKIPRYLVYDIVVFQEENCAKMSFKKRLEIIKTEIISPRHEAMKKNLIDRKYEPFSVRNKEFWEITWAERLLSPKFIRQLPHKPDGLIFQPVKEPYTAGACQDILKWKPICLNSVDFKLKISMEQGMGIVSKKVGLLFAGGMDNAYFDKIDYHKSLNEFDGKIIECSFENGKWKFLRERTDKNFPNAYTTAKAVCESIKYPITEEKLLSYIANEGYQPKKEDSKDNK